MLYRPSSSRGDNEINKKSSLKYFHKVIKRVNERDNEHEIQTINQSMHGVSKGINIEQQLFHAE